ncbi:MAG: carboxypeptidase-like regulatory domain-containing protein [Chthoniobacterales bacterium]
MMLTSGSVIMTSRARMDFRRFVCLTASCAFLAAALPATAGSEYGGVVRGKIVRAGEPVANIAVTLQDESGQQYAPVFTDRSGMFVVTGVKAGKHKILLGRGDNALATEIIAGPDLTNVSPIELNDTAVAPKASFALTQAPLSPNAITTEEARAFVRDHMATTAKGNLDGVMETYAPQVDYYEHGVRDREFILKDQQKYLSRYSTRTYEVGAIDVIRSDVTGQRPNPEADSVKVSFSFRYKLSAPGKPEKSGTASELWVLQKVNGRLQIVACKENVTKD